MSKKEIIKQLNKNRAKNISLLGVIENYGIESSLKFKDSYLITVKTDHFWCYPAVEGKNESEIRELKNKDANLIFAHSHYQDFTSKAYIKERIATDCSAGIFINEELAAWSLTHDDGAVGFIHVREDFRENGYAHLILEKLIKSKRENVKDVFLNVEPDNLKAKKLFYSLGFEFDRLISWLKLKEK